MIFSGTLGYEQVKVNLFLFSTAFIFILWSICLSKHNPEVTFKISKLKILTALFLFSLLLSSIIGVEPIQSLVGAPPYYQGFITYCFLFLFFIVVASVEIKPSHYFKVLVGSTLFVSLLALKQWLDLNMLHLPTDHYSGRVVSTFGQPNLYSGFILLTFPMWYWLFKNYQSKFWWGVVGVINLFGLMISGSRTAQVILLGVVVIWLINKFLHHSRVWIAPLLILLVFLTALSWQLWQSEFINPTDQLWLLQNAPEKRLLLWPEVVELIKPNLFLGVGLENLNLDLRGQLFNRAHNYLLDLFVFSGVLGLIFYLELIVNMFRKNKLTLLTICLGIYLVWSFFQIQSIIHLIYFFLLLGLIDKQPSLT